MPISSVFPTLHPMLKSMREIEVTDLSGNQKQVWQDFLTEGKPVQDLTNNNPTPGFRPSPTKWEEPLYELNPPCVFSHGTQIASLHRRDVSENSLPMSENKLGVRVSSWRASPYHFRPFPSLSADYSSPMHLKEYREVSVSPLNENYNELEQAAIEPNVASLTIRTDTTAYLVNLASELLAEETPITSDWLTEHLGVAKLLIAFPELAEYLNTNTEAAEKFRNSIEESKQILEDFFDDKAVKNAGELLSDDSPITEDWLSENIPAAYFLAKHPAFVAYLNKNGEEAEKFISVSA